MSIGKDPPGTGNSSNTNTKTGTIRGAGGVRRVRSSDLARMAVYASSSSSGVSSSSGISLSTASSIDSNSDDDDNNNNSNSNNNNFRTVSPTPPPRRGNVRRTTSHSITLSEASNGLKVGTLRRGVKRSQSTAVPSNNNNNNSSLLSNHAWLTSHRTIITLLVAGVLVCLLDVAYIGSTVEQQQEQSIKDGIPSASATSLSSTLDNSPHRTLLASQHLVKTFLHKMYHNVLNKVIPDENESQQLQQHSDDHANESNTPHEHIEKDRQQNGMDNSVPEPIHVDENTFIEGFTEGGKGPIIRLVQEALGQTEIDPALIEKLPTVEDVTALYGSEPKVYGLESCSRFQQMGIPSEHFVTTAGTFNTGTNLMAELLSQNCYLPARYAKYQTAGVRWQVLWGKHTPVFNESFRLSHRVSYNDTIPIHPQDFFPAVMIRDPYKWMQSMCRHHYGAVWNMDISNRSHCPNLKPVSKKLRAQMESVPVHVHYKKFTVEHDSLVDFWNDWYKEYIDNDFPKLIVRFEDVIFYPKQITKVICECAGGRLMHPDDKFVYITDSAKKGAAHGKDNEKTSYVDALVKYGTEKGRYIGYYDDDIHYANDKLDPYLMNLFGYRYATTTSSELSLSSSADGLVTSAI